MDHANQFDVVIAGAGVAGCATAIAINQHAPHLRVCLISRDSYDSVKPATRSSAKVASIGETLPAEVALPLKRLGLWQDFLDQSFLRSTGTCSVWGADTAHSNESIFTTTGDGWHLDRERFDLMMFEAARRRGVKIIGESRLQSIDITGHTRRIGFKSLVYPFASHCASASLVIDATGRKAALTRRLGIERRQYDNLVGLYRFYESAEPAVESVVDSTTLIESTEHGWWYKAALPNGRQVVALMVDADYSRSARLHKCRQFDQLMMSGSLVRKRLEQEGMLPVTAPIVCAAQTQCQEKIAGTGWLAVGDAAFTFDPLSSLGIFKALRMSLLASYAVSDFFSGIDTGFRKYQAVGEQEFNSYLVKRTQYYSREQRYTDSPFWQRRIAA